MNNALTTDSTSSNVVDEQYVLSSNQARQNLKIVIDSLNANNSTPSYDEKLFPISNTVVNDLWTKLVNIESESIRRQIINIFFSFLIAEKNHKDQIEQITLKPLSLTCDYDGDVLIEWIYPDFRLGFSLSDDENESTWFYVTSEKFDSKNLSGYLHDINLESFILGYSILIFTLI